jgi:LPXTG-site transpeptidase (sortase) family protein
MSSKRSKVFRYVGIGLVVIGILIVAYPAYTNLVMNRKEVDILNSWGNQVKALVQGDTSQAQTTGVSGDTGVAGDTGASGDTGAPGDTGSLVDTGVQVTGQTVTTGQSGNTIQTQSSETLTSGTESNSSAATTVVTTKTPIFKISIPKINIEWVVYDGTDVATLKSGPGHYTGTAMPGQTGVCIIAGHRTTYGAPFNKVDLLTTGDSIILETSDGKQYTYLFTKNLEVLPDDLSSIIQTDYPSLILSTCTPKFYATKRLLIFATLSQ